MRFPWQDEHVSFSRTHFSSLTGLGTPDAHLLNFFSGAMLERGADLPSLIVVPLFYLLEPHRQNSVLELLGGPKIRRLYLISVFEKVQP